MIRKYSNDKKILFHFKRIVLIAIRYYAQNAEIKHTIQNKFISYYFLFKFKTCLTLY